MASLSLKWGLGSPGPGLRTAKSKTTGSQKRICKRSPVGRRLGASSAHAQAGLPAGGCRQTGLLFRIFKAPLIKTTGRGAGLSGRPRQKSRGGKSFDKTPHFD